MPFNTPLDKLQMIGLQVPLHLMADTGYSYNCTAHQSSSLYIQIVFLALFQSVFAEAALQLSISKR